MGILSRKVKAAEFGSASVKAQAGYSNVGNFITYTTSRQELVALSNPTISRSHDLIASMLGALEFRHFTRQWTGKDYEKIYIPNESWMDRPDPNVTRNFFLANIFTDLYLYGAAVAYVTSRYSNGFPAGMTWLPFSSITFPNMTGPQFYGQPKEVEFNGQILERENCIVFLSPIIGLLYSGNRAINIATHLDQAADRYASLETVPGWLSQKGGETMSGDELSDLASAWAAARKSNAIGALNDMVSFNEFSNDPMEMISDQRKYQALELSRIASVPPYLLGIDVGSYAYQTPYQARKDLYLFGARPYLDCIQETLSLDNVLPPNKFVEFDVDSWLEHGEMENENKDDDKSSARELAEIIQKIYLGVGKVITVDEARMIINEAGGSLPPSSGELPFAMPAPSQPTETQ